ncbi:MAG: DUF3786 domain-containing protein [Faecousia sp.]
MADNYEITKRRTAKVFLTYDQNLMAGKRGAWLDEKRIYLRFIGQTYGIDRKTGVVTCVDEQDREAGFSEAMTIYDALCDAKQDYLPSGRFCRINRMKGVAQTSGLGEGMHGAEARLFGADPAGFAGSCRRLGGIPFAVGDIAYRIPLFDDMDVVVQLWEPDEDFPANLCVLWDENTLQCIKYETTYYALGHLLRRLRENMEK